MGKQFSSDEIALVISEKLKGTGSRAIGKQLGRSKSAVNYVWNRVKDNLEERDLPRQPKILLFDLEVAPELKLGYNRYRDFTPQDFVLQHHFIYSFAAKWLGEENIFSAKLPDYEGYEPMKDCDEAIVRDLHALLDEADIIIAHNLKGFDWKVSNARFVKYGLGPVSPVKLLDTLDIAKQQFRFPNNKLDTIAHYLDVGEKMSIDSAKLWRGCFLGDMEAWEENEAYNIQDVDVLEGVYLKLRAYDKKHPNLALFYPDNQKRCVCCGSTDLTLTDKKSYTSVSEFNIYQCNSCGKHNRARVNQLDKDKRNALLMNCQ